MGAIVVLLGGSIAEICASDWQSWLGAAVLVRCGVGLAQSILITYVSELSPFQIRGFMIGAYQLCLAIGQLISAVATQLVIETQPTKWKPLIATEFVFTGILILLIGFVPESHIHHARKGNHEKAKESMLKLYGNAPGYDVVSNIPRTLSSIRGFQLADEVALFRNTSTESSSTVSKSNDHSACLPRIRPFWRYSPASIGEEPWPVVWVFAVNGLLVHLLSLDILP
jgi:MFS family permease